MGHKYTCCFFAYFDFRKMQNPNWIFCRKSEKWETEDCIKKRKISNINVGQLSWNFKNSQQLTFFESENLSQWEPNCPKVAKNPYLYKIWNFALIIRKNKYSHMIFRFRGKCKIPAYVATKNTPSSVLLGIFSIALLFKYF